MVKQNHNKLVREFDKLNESEALAVNQYITELLSARPAKSNEAIINDDLITSLSNRRENQRARQVIEWEKARRKNLPKTA
jgi:hypothetical protein